MCFGFPMQISSVDGLQAMASGQGRTQPIDLSLIGQTVRPGDHVLVYLGAAVRTLEADEAQKIGDAIEAVDAAARGEPFEHLVADLIEREPELPAHLKIEKETV